MGTDKVGPAGQRVAENVKRIRGLLPVRTLSDRLSQLGRPILASGITKIEQGERRVDADDLVALAIALNVTPNRLLLPDHASQDPNEVGEVFLAPKISAPEWVAWSWAMGEEPLWDTPWSEVPRSDVIERFRRENVRHEAPSTFTGPIESVEEHQETIDALKEVAEAGGIPLDDVGRLLDYSVRLERIRAIREKTGKSTRKRK